MSIDQSKSRCPGGSVGAIFRRDGKYLLLYRTSFPSGLAGIAGHIDEGETSEQAMIREVLEESGVTVKTSTLLLHEEFANPCKRGFTSHEWWVYEVTSWEGEPTVMEPDKHAFVRWLSPTEIQGYIASGDVDPAWLQYIFPALFRI